MSAVPFKDCSLSAVPFKDCSLSAVPFGVCSLSAVPFFCDPLIVTSLAGRANKALLPMFVNREQCSQLKDRCPAVFRTH